MQGGSATCPEPRSCDKRRHTPKLAPPDTVFFLDPFLFTAFLAWATGGQIEMGSEERERPQKSKSEMKFFSAGGLCKGLARESLRWLAAAEGEALPDFSCAVGGCMCGETENKPAHNKITECWSVRRRLPL